MEAVGAAARGLLGASSNTVFPPGVSGPGEIAPNVWVVDLGSSHGPDYEFVGVRAIQWIAFAVSISILVFYAWHTWKATCGWEEVYVCAVERAWEREGR